MMCGINGFLDFNRTYDVCHRHDIVHRMNERIIHRGPDSEGIYDGEWLSMGMRRLSIIDLQTGNQPIYNEDKSIVIVFNGEIYNYKSIRKELREKGHIFRTDSDTETIIHLYEELGECAFEKLDGMFVFSIYDHKRECVFIVRDRIGEKPLYYTDSDVKNVFCYASELRSILEVGVISKVIDKEALMLYLEYTYIPAPYSIYQDIRKLLAGHYLCITNEGKVLDKKYWDISVNSDYEALSYQDAKFRLKELLSKSVRERMNCDVPFGAFLSGGVDSGVIVALMAENSAKAINTFTLGYEEAGYSESKNAKYLARHFGTNHHEHILTYKDSINALTSVIEHFDEPFADSSAIPEYLVSKLASQYVKVVLTGDAGDEMFLGYDKYAIDYYVNKYLKIPAIGRALFEKIVKFYPDKTAFSRKMRKVITNASKDIFTKRCDLMKLGFKDVELRSLLTDEYFSDLTQNIVREYFETAPRNSELSKVQYADIKVVLEGDMLFKVDRMTMFNSIESRTPMLANDIVEFAYSIPNSYKLDRRNKKKILKETFADLLPKDYDKLPKMGFGVPIDYWFRTEMKEELMDLLNPNSIKLQGIFNPDYVTSMLNEHITGEINRKSELWCIYVFEKWLSNIR